MRLAKKLSALLCAGMMLSPLAVLTYRNSVKADVIPESSYILRDETDANSGTQQVDSFYSKEQDKITEEVPSGYKILPKTFIEMLEKAIAGYEDKMDVYSLGIEWDKDKIESDVQYFRSTHPAIFYVPTIYFTSYNGIMDEVYLYYSADKDYLKKIVPKVEAATNEAMSLLDASMSDYQKALVIHDWLVYQTAYAYDRLQNNELTEDDYNLIGPLANKEGVCEGYTDAYNFLLKFCGIQSEMVSNLNMLHAWNVVKIGSEYYNLDATWDDPVYDTIGYVKHIYFLVDNETMYERSHHRHEVAENFDENKLKSKTFVNGKWVDVTSPISFYKGEWYYSAWDESNLCAVLCKTSDILKKDGTVIYSFGSETGLWGVPSSYYAGSYSYPILFSHYLIFNTNQSICYFDLDNMTAEPTVMYKASEIPGVNVAGGYYIHGFKVMGDKLLYSVNTLPEASEIKTLPNKLKAEATPTPAGPTKAVTPTITPTPVTPTTAPVTPKPGDPTPTSAPGQPTVTPKPGDPTPTTAPGQPTVTPKPGEPTPTTAPGQPTVTPKPGEPTPTTAPEQPTVTPKPGDPTPDPEKEPSIADFVERLYTVALNRASEPEGKAYWVKEIENGNRTGGDCAHFFLIEAEEFRNRGLNEEDFVETLYLTFFDRASEPNGKAFWVGQLKSGTMTRNQVISGFIDSTEWCNVCATYGVKSGAPNAKAEFASKNAINFATRLYTCCLGRAPEDGGLKYWSLALTNLEQTGCSAAKNFFKSDEFVNFKLKNDEYVRRLYTTFMGRDPEASEVAYWTGEIAKGTQTKDSVMAFFGQSEEFTNICKKYGIDRGTI